MLQIYRHSCSRLYFFEKATSTGFVTCSVIASHHTVILQNYIIQSDTNKLHNLLCNSLLLYSHAIKLCNTRIASMKCTKRHHLDARWCNSRYSEICLQDHGKAFWWLYHFMPFSFSVTSVIPRFDCYGFLILVIYQIKSLHEQSTNLAGFNIQ